MVTTAPAVNETAPAEVRFRCDQASEVGFANVSASASPIDTEPAEAPAATVETVAVVEAVAASEPTEVAAPVPRVAVERTSAIEIATAGATATLPPVAPALASVVSVCVFVAISVTAPAFVRAAPFCNPAWTRSSIRFSATEAPIPTDDPPTVVFGSAVAVELAVDVALIDTAPEPAFVLEPVRSSASVSMLTMFKPSEPATPTLPPPAPEDASAPKPPEPFVLAVSETDVAETVPPIVASASKLASVIATPTPTFAVPPPVAEPSAFDFALAVTEETSFSAPEAVIETPVRTTALTKTSVTLTATAAPTDTVPDDVDALGGDAAEPPPPFAT